LDVATASYNYHDVGVWLGKELRLLAEDPSGVWSGYGRGNVSGSEDRDYWSFHGRAGDVLSVAVEVPGSPEGSGLNFSVRRPDDTQLTAFNADYQGRGQSEPVTLGQTGTHAVVVRENYGYRGEYRIRVTLVRGGIQMERENNNSVGQVHVPVLTLEEGRQKGRVHGYVGVADGNGDYFGLGNLTVGTEIQLGLVKPATSPLSWVLEVYRGDGTKVAEGEAGATPLVHVVAEGAARTVPRPIISRAVARTRARV
jgi:hypothetical protein